MAFAPEIKACAATTSTGSAAKITSAVSSGVSRRRHASAAAPPASTTNGIGPNTASWPARNSSNSTGSNSSWSVQLVSAAVWATVEKPFVAFHTRLGAATRAKAAPEAARAAGDQRRRISGDARACSTAAPAK